MSRSSAGTPRASGDLRHGLPLDEGRPWALRDHDVRPGDRAVRPVPLALRRAAAIEDPAAGRTVRQPAQERGHPALVDPRRQQACQRRRPGRVRVHVRGDVDAPRARPLERLEGLAHLGPVRLQARLEVGDLDRHAALVPDPDRLGDRCLERRPFAPDVGRVEAAGPAPGHPGQRNQLRRVRVDARRVDEPRRQPEGPRVERLAEERGHAPRLVSGGGPLLESHRRDPEGPVADEGHDVAREPGLAQPVEPGAEAGPAPVELGGEECGPFPEQPAAGRRRGRGEPAHARHLGGDALANLGLGGWVGEERKVGVGVHVDEAGRDHAPRGIDHLTRLARQVGRDGRDSVPGQRDVRPPPRGPGPVEDRSPADQPVERHARGSQARRARSGAGRLTGPVRAWAPRS